MSLLTLHSLFTDHAVLQRNQPIPVRGTARPGAEVTVEFDQEIITITTDQSGQWLATFNARSASGPHTLLVSCDEAQRACSGIYIGEVWLGSGQSNMDWPLAQTSDAVAEIFGARFPEIHFFKIPQNPHLKPQSDIATHWTPCTPDTARNFSGVLYHFARRLLPEIHCHIGLIHSAWGGTDALPWTPRAAIELEPKLAHALEHLETVHEIAPPVTAKAHPDTGNTGEAKGWALASCPDEEWPILPLPCLWQQQGLLFNGAVWFRRTIEIPSAWAGHELTLSLGVIDDFDTTYFNGAPVGAIGKENLDAYRTPRIYTIPAHLVQAGRAIIAVRVYDHMGEGGMIGPKGSMVLCQKNDFTQQIPLAGDWRYQVERAIPLPCASGQASGEKVPSALYNGMISPLAGFPLRGFLWYQGENDIVRASLYSTILTALIQGWRTAWGQPALPFYLVQLPNYQTPPPWCDDEWVELREAQAEVTGRVPSADYVTTLDCGDALDIHPPDKRTVGRRLAEIALANDYGIPTPHRGPRYHQHQINGDTIQIDFIHFEPLLRSSDGAPVRGFTIAGEDQKFISAEAVITGPNTIAVRHASIPTPVAVRYAWCAAPLVNLQSGNGMPTAPFRTDTWPRFTEGRK